MSWIASRWAAQVHVGYAPAKAVLLVLAETVDADTFSTKYVDTALLAERAELTKRTVITALAFLEGKAGAGDRPVRAPLIARERRSNPKTGYRVNDEITLLVDPALGAGDASRLPGQDEPPAPREAPEADAKVQMVHSLDANDSAPRCTTFTAIPSVYPSKDPSLLIDSPSDEAFERWWLAYPQSGRKAKKAVRAKFKLILKKGDTGAEHLIAAAERYGQFCSASGRWVANALTWLSQERWADEPEVPPPRNSDARDNRLDRMMAGAAATLDDDVPANRPLGARNGREAKFIERHDAIAAAMRAAAKR